MNREFFQHELFDFICKFISPFCLIWRWFIPFIRIANFNNIICQDVSFR